MPWLVMKVHKLRCGLYLLVSFPPPSSCLLAMLIRPPLLATSEPFMTLHNNDLCSRWATQIDGIALVCSGQQHIIEVSNLQAHNVYLHGKITKVFV